MESEEDDYSIELNRVQKNIKLFLAKVASQKGVVSYSDLCRGVALPYSMANPDHRNQLAEDLGRVSVEELYIYERPMLSCVVVDKNTMMPGKGFFDLAQELCDIKIEDRMVFLAEEMRDTHEFWSSVDGKKEIARLEKEIASFIS
ncbi:MAG: hypothetical protein K2F94_04060 [Muribaculaceae bacterium]|nr:hypothetical protein [Muribaculaceae bacterium]